MGLDELVDDLNAAVLLAASDYNINSASVTLSTPGTYTISGTGAKTTNNITISGPGEYDISLVNVNINCSATKGKAAMALQNGAQVRLTIANTSTLVSGENRAGIEVPEDCSLEIDGTGKLTVTGGAGQYDAAAGIGGGANQTNGPITISGGNITANGGDHSYNGASGIGGGCGADGQDITISGGTVVANGSIESYNGAAGIGGGSLGSAADITVLGGTVTAYASKNSHLGAAGIGGGYMGSAQRLSFSGGTTNAASSSGANTNGAGIGGGYGGTASYITISGDATVKSNEGNPNAKFDGSKPALNKADQLEETAQGIENLLNAIQQGILTASTKARLEQLEETKAQLEISMAQAELKKPLLSKKQILFWLHRFRGIDTSKPDQRQRLIDSFVNAVYVYDDKIVLTFNYRDGTETITLQDIEGSDLGGSPPPTETDIQKDVRFCLLKYRAADLLLFDLSSSHLSEKGTPAAASRSGGFLQEISRSATG